MDELAIPFLGAERARRQYPFGDLHRAGASIALGSDWPVTSPDPFLAIHVAVNRTLPTAAGGYGGEPFLPDQSLRLESMLSAYTFGSASINGVDDRAGAIRPGFDADVIVVDADLAHVDPQDIFQAQVQQTWVRGGLVHSRR
jgi:predicted amidohydrolase YtcJ